MNFRIGDMLVNILAKPKIIYCTGCKTKTYNKLVAHFNRTVETPSGHETVRFHLCENCWPEEIRNAYFGSPATPKSTLNIGVEFEYVNTSLWKRHTQQLCTKCFECNALINSNQTSYIHSTEHGKLTLFCQKCTPDYVKAYFDLPKADTFFITIGGHNG